MRRCLEVSHDRAGGAVGVGEAAVIYAAVIACGVHGCIAVTDNRGPYRTEAECRARQDEMRPAVLFVTQRIGAPVTREICGTLDEVRRHIPHAFAGEANT